MRWIFWVDHDRNIRSRKQKTDIGKYSSVNRTIQLWNQLPADALGTLSSKSSNSRKVINRAKGRCGGIIKNAMKLSKLKVREVNCGENVKGGCV
jgi:hypothetical protein